MKRKFKRSSWASPLLVMFCLIFILGLSGCGENASDPPKAAAAAAGGVTVSTVSLGTDATTVKSDNSSGATITATVLDAANAVIEGMTVAFTATGGTLSASSVKTDASG